MSVICAVLHAHSTWSYDGHWTLPEIARLYGRLGVNAVMMSEHDTGFDPARFAEYRAACAAASTSRCTLIPGIEYSSPCNRIHILTWGLTRFLAEHRPVRETLENTRDLGGVAIFAHPARRQAWQQFDPDWAPFLSGIELWNRKSDGLLWGSEAWQLIRQTGLPATVGQDFHRMKQLYPLTMQFAAGPEADFERHLVNEIAEGKGRPMVFRRPVLNYEASPKKWPHQNLERGRSRLIKLRKTLRKNSI